MKISAIVMASGLSERMGTNKLLMDLKGKQLYQWTFDLLEEVAFDEVIIVSSYEEILEDAKNRGFKAIFNDNNQVGKSASIKLGVDAVDGENAMMFFVADQPLLTADTVNKLIDAYEKNPIITYPRTDKRRGAPVIFPNSYREGLLGLKYDEGGMKLVGGEDKNEVYIEDVSELWDVDTYNNLEEIREKYE
ncbi:nucleotidyltransferase family protein [Anaerococcus sp. AGMB09787]|uniref:nucleotidyltransferase family protein n=1 Tax=Anaerococcus sp. AGMB09787 TaxID=2922869 RepID=UPI001FAFE76C|nr:nucleotidyltransferase family protein [Anaerococcus sp. AGMB09787]